jgi:ABC-2 type transport system permease protein
MEKEKILRILGEPAAPTEAEKVPMGQKAWAFIVRDFKIYWTYRFWVLFDIIDVVILVATYYFVAQIISPARLIAEGYSTGDYFTFAMLGIAFSQYVQNSVHGLTEGVRDEQWTGTIETILSSSTDYKSYLLGASGFRFLYGTIILIGALALGFLMGGKVILTFATFLTGIVFAVLLVSGHLAIGAMSAGIVIMIKRGDPIAMGFTWLTQLVSGVFYPLGLLPWYLKWLGFALPLTYSLDGLRRTFMNGETLLDSSTIQIDLVALLVFLVVMVPLSLRVFAWAYRRAQKQGTLGQY